MSNKFDVIAALDRKQGIGRNGKLPWHLPADLKYFHDMTTGGVIIMGRKTWDSIPTDHFTLQTRVNIVVSRNPNLNLPEGALLSGSLEEALAIADEAQNATQNAKPIFVIGGAEIYTLALAHPDCSNLYLTHIEAEFDCDTFFPDYKDQFELCLQGKTQTYEQLQFAFCQYKRNSDPA